MDLDANPLTAAAVLVLTVIALLGADRWKLRAASKRCLRCGRCSIDVRHFPESRGNGSMVTRQCFHPQCGYQFSQPVAGSTQTQ